MEIRYDSFTFLTTRRLPEMPSYLTRAAVALRVIAVGHDCPVTKTHEQGKISLLELWTNPSKVPQ